MNAKKLLIVVVMIGAAIIGLSFLKLGDSMVYFYTPAEAFAKASELQSKEIRVGGLVMPGSVQKNDATLELGFKLTDLKGAEIQVSYQGAPPDMFKESQGVVCEGRIQADGTRFAATRLFVKHSEEYKKPDDHSSMNAEYLQRSMFKNE